MMGSLPAMKLALPILAALLLAGCGNSAADEAEQDIPGIGANGRRDLAGAFPNLRGKKAGLSYGAYDSVRDHRGTGLAFAGYGCTTNCADVMKGYQRADQAKIEKADLCSGDTWGELEGCVAFTQGLPSNLSNLLPLEK